MPIILNVIYLINPPACINFSFLVLPPPNSEQICLSHLDSEFHTRLLSPFPVQIPSNPEYAPIDLARPSSMQAQAPKLLFSLPIAGLAFHREESTLFVLGPHTWSPLCVNASLILFYSQHPFLGPSTVPILQASQYGSLPCLSPSNDFRPKQFRKKRKGRIKGNDSFFSVLLRQTNLRVKMFWFLNLPLIDTTQVKSKYGAIQSHLLLKIEFLGQHL